MMTFHSTEPKKPGATVLGEYGQTLAASCALLFRQDLQKLPIKLKLQETSQGINPLNKAAKVNSNGLRRCAVVDDTKNEQAGN